MGSALENEWGSFEFNVYYRFGMVGAIIAALLSGYADNTYLNLSLFLAFAQLFPEERLMLFYLIPVKVKWLAYVDWVLFGLALVFGNWSTRAAVSYTHLDVYKRQIPRYSDPAIQFLLY